MKILQVIDQLDVGGAEKVLVDIANLTSKNSNYHVGVMSILQEGEYARELSSKIEQYYLGRTRKFSMNTWFKAFLIVRRYDIVHIHLRHNLKYLLPIMFLLRGKKYIFHDHFGDIEFNQSFSLSFGISLWFINHYIGVSRALVDWAEANFHFLQKNTSLLTNIIIKYGNSKPSESESFRIISTGNLRPTKNHEFALELIRRLPKYYNLHIYGKPVDLAYTTDLEKKIAAMKLSDRVQVFKDCSNIQAILHKYFMAIHTSKSETGPLVLLEYLAQRTPFICYDTGQIAKLTSPTIPEFVIDNFKLGSWIKSINYISNTLQEKPNYFDKRMDTLFSQFSQEGYCLKLMNIYSSIK